MYSLEVPAPILQYLNQRTVSFLRDLTFKLSVSISQEDSDRAKVPVIREIIFPEIQNGLSPQIPAAILASRRLSTILVPLFRILRFLNCIGSLIGQNRPTLHTRMIRFDIRYSILS